MEKPFSSIHWIWFLSGFGVGLMMISLSQAAIPKRITPRSLPAQSGSNLVREMKAPQVKAPDLEGEFSSLSQIEKKFVESPRQQELLRRAAAGSEGNPGVKKRTKQ
jgi:hypothetical protein